MRYYTLVFFLIFISSVSFSQKKVKLKDLPKQEQKFFNLLTEKFQKSSKKKEGKILIDEFFQVWVEGAFSEEWKNEIYRTVEALKFKRAAPFPHYTNYLKTLMAFSKNDEAMSSYDAWHKALIHITQDKKISIRKLSTFLETSLNLVSSNIIYQSSLATWKTDEANYKFYFDKKNIIYIIFEDINLTCYSRNDSSTIYNTKGVFYMLKKGFVWDGANGKVTWKRAGFKSDEVYAHLRRYKILMKKNEYKADSVSFINMKYFNKPLLGKLEEKILAFTTSAKATYPRFDSYTKRLEIPGIYKDLDFDGGFAMRGSKFLGFGTAEDLAYLNIYRNDTVFLTVAAKEFIFKKDKILGPDSYVKFQLDTDSIYHENILFKYSITKRQVDLIRDGKGMSINPFYDTFHRLDMDFQELIWNIDDPKIYFKMLRGGSGINNAEFISSDYFKEAKFDYLQMLDAQNPLYRMRQYTKEYGDEFYADDYASFLGYDYHSVIKLLLRLNFMGLLTYNPTTKIVQVNPRLYDYINNHRKKRDYDVLQFNSTTYKTTPNATMNLLNFDIHMNGVSSVQLSDSQNVVVYPAGKELTMKRNRLFAFDGKVQAGLFTFFGKDFEFNYDNFKIDLNNVDSLKIIVATNEQSKNGKQLYTYVTSVIENVRGNLLIDDARNKSGIKDYDQYPIFNSKKDSYVFYDKKGDKVYDRDKFYFKVFPYQIDSLDNFSNAALHFDGHFASSGILPSFDETLVLQQDYSLGFTRMTPPGGYPLYGGKGVFNNKLNVSNQGLRGDGDFEYLTSTTKSNNFIFYPDSMNTHAQDFNNKKQVGPPEYPNVKGEYVYVHWDPYKDQLLANKEKEPMTMFDKQAYMHGKLLLEPTGLTGWGKMEIETSNLISDQFVYSMNLIDADTSKFVLKSLDLGDLAFSTENVNAHVDFIKRLGEFKSNGEASFVSFPKNQYICYMDQINWYMDNAEIEMSVNTDKAKEQENYDDLSPIEQEDIQLEGPKFISVHPKQDSLQFVSPTAKYSLVRHLITAQEVKFIRAADATIYPNGESVIIEKKAVMREIENCEIKANNTTRYHNIYNATAKIYGRKRFEGSGDYDYIDETERKQKIHFNEIKQDSTIQTYAKGKIIEPDAFTLSPNYDYQGDVELRAANEFLTFEGAIKMRHDCDMIGSKWLKFRSEIDPNDIFIPIDSIPKNINNDILTAGMRMTYRTDSSHIYSSFLTKPKERRDLPVLSVGGFLHYDKDDGKYKISNKEKLEEFNLPGNYMHMHKSICNIYGEGKMDFGMNLGQVSLIPVGKITQDMVSYDLDMTIVLSMDFYFAPNAIKRMAEMMIEDEKLQGVDMSSKVYSKAITELVGVEKSEKWLSQIALGNLKKYPKELNDKIILSDVTMVWNQETNSYISEGPIGVGSIYKKQINKYVSGYIQITRKRGGDMFNMFLQIDSEHWFFFKYRAGQMLGLSSDVDFNKIIVETKKDKLKKDVEKGEAPYRFYIANKVQKKKFIRAMEELNEEEEDNGDE